MTAKGRTTAESLLISLRAKGFTLLPLAGGKLLVTPAPKLTTLERMAIVQSKEELLALLAYEVAPPATDADLRAWFHSAENPPPRNVLAVPFDEANDDH